MVVRNALLAFSAGLLVAFTGACSADPASGQTTASSSDAGSEAASAPADPTGGRDASPASCYAACQNSAFNCQTTGSLETFAAEVALDDRGCSGTLTPAAGSSASVALKLDCRAATVCRASAAGQDATACVPGSFSAFTFAFAGNIVCTRR
jgi:hypothetical protein